MVYESISLGIRRLARQGNKFVVSIPRQLNEWITRNGIKYVEVTIKPIDLKPKGEPNKIIEKRGGD